MGFRTIINRPKHFVAPTTYSGHDPFTIDLNRFGNKPKFQLIINQCLGFEWIKIELIAIMPGNILDVGLIQLNISPKSKLFGKIKSAYQSKDKKSLVRLWRRCIDVNVLIKSIFCFGTEHGKHMLQNDLQNMLGLRSDVS